MNTIETLQAFETAFIALKTKKQMLAAEVSKLDSEINEYYHVIEAINVNAAELMKITKLLKTALKARRIAKEESIMICNIMNNTIGEKIHNLSGAIEKEANNSVERVSKYEAESQASYTKIFGKTKKQ